MYGKLTFTEKVKNFLGKTYGKCYTYDLRNTNRFPRLDTMIHTCGMLRDLRKVYKNTSCQASVFIALRMSVLTVCFEASGISNRENRRKS